MWRILLDTLPSIISLIFPIPRFPIIITSYFPLLQKSIIIEAGLPLRRLKIFFNYINLLPKDTIEERCNLVAARAIRDPTCAFNLIIKFLQFQKQRVEKEETLTINDMSLNFQKEIRNFIRSLPNVELKHDPMSEEAYFYGLRNFVHFHGPRHIDIRLSKTQQEEALRTNKALRHHYAPQAGWVSCVILTAEQTNNTKQLIRQAYDTCASLKIKFKSAK